MVIGKRKIVLLSIIAVLLAMCIIAAVAGKKSGIKIMKLSDSPDMIVMKKAGEEVVLNKTSDGEWTINNSDFRATKAYADNIERVLKELKVLAKAGKSSSEIQLEKFGLSSDQAIEVKAFKNGSVVRKLLVGKVSSTSTQSYAIVNDSSDIILASGNLPAIFGKSEEDLRNHVIYKLNVEEIQSVTIQTEFKEWGVERASEVDADEALWKFTGKAASAEIDSEETDLWVMTLDSLTASKWLADDVSLPAKMEGKVTLTTKDRSVVLEFYKLSEGDEKYVCKSNLSSHNFEVLTSVAQKYLIQPERLIKK